MDTGSTRRARRPTTRPARRLTYRPGPGLTVLLVRGLMMGSIALFDLAMTHIGGSSDPPTITKDELLTRHQAEALALVVKVCDKPEMTWELQSQKANRDPAAVLGEYKSVATELSGSYRVYYGTAELVERRGVSFFDRRVEMGMCTSGLYNAEPAGSTP